MHFQIRSRLEGGVWRAGGGYYNAAVAVAAAAAAAAEDITTKLELKLA